MIGEEGNEVMEGKRRIREEEMEEGEKNEERRSGGYEGGGVEREWGEIGKGGGYGG